MISLLPYFGEISFFHYESYSTFLLGVKRVPSAFSCFDCLPFPQPQLRFPGGCSSCGTCFAFSGFTAACPRFAPPQEPARRGWRVLATRPASRPVPTPARTDVPWREQQRKHPFLVVKTTFLSLPPYGYPCLWFHLPC